MSSEQAGTDRPPAKRRRLLNTVLVGTVSGAVVAVVFLVLFMTLVAIRSYFSTVSPTDPHEPALSMTWFLGGVVCFGPPFILICAAIGTVGGLIRWRM